MNKTMISVFLLSTAMLIGGGNIEPETSVSNTVSNIVPIISSSTGTQASVGMHDTPSLPMLSTTKSALPNDDRVYVDKRRKLIWQDEAYTEDETAAFKREHSTEKAGDYPHARSYCENLHYATFVDWRLPTSDELISVHHTNGEVFSETRDTDFWTSTPTTQGRYYVIYPADAMRYARSAGQSNFIRCVRELEDK
ncbi:MAG: DUF1566 domain-containing protein [Sulfurovum sp.]|nr:DUF1566 domain-containing protein [Sulfurovum sp.]